MCGDLFAYQKKIKIKHYKKLAICIKIHTINRSSTDRFGIFLNVESIDMLLMNEDTNKQQI